jgi:hypothetical protein
MNDGRGAGHRAFMSRCFIDPKALWDKASSRFEKRRASRADTLFLHVSRASG